VVILALDTTTRAGSVAVTRGGTVLAVIDGDASRTHGERLPQELDETLRQAGVDVREVTLLVVASGPGAFTGLRIGLAAIQGLALVTGIPVVGVSALDALAKIALDGERGSPQVMAWMDAARGEVFSARYAAAANDIPAPVDDPIVSSPAAILSALRDLDPAHAVFAGDGALRYRAEIDAWSGGAARIVAPVPALAPALAWIGARRAAAGAAGPPHALQPLYVRRSDAELERVRKGAP
jgi:tRNA threonylcarbamoyladenosine biosynthesis protein TsaB